MEREEQWKDWILRYNNVYKKRQSFKQKSRFLRSLSTDLQLLDKEFEIEEYSDSGNKKDTTRNVYVGDIENAKKVVTTYYDTPAKHFGSYHYFDIEKNGKNTILFTMLFAIIYLIVGALATIYIMESNFEVLSFTGLIVVVFYFLYFYIFSKNVKGISRRNNLVQNTSSVVMMLDYINNSKYSNNVAFAFVDKGTTSKQGLNNLLNEIKATTRVMYLDSIGSSQPIEVITPSTVIENSDESESESFMTHNDLDYVLTRDSKISGYFLKKSELNSKEINQDNLEQTNQFINEFLKG